MIKTLKDAASKQGDFISLILIFSPSNCIENKAIASFAFQIKLAPWQYFPKKRSLFTLQHTSQIAIKILTPDLGHRVLMLIGLNSVGCTSKLNVLSIPRVKLANKANSTYKCNPPCKSLRQREKCCAGEAKLRHFLGLVLIF